MSTSEIVELIELQKKLIFEEKRRLGLLHDIEIQYVKRDDDLQENSGQETNGENLYKETENCQESYNFESAPTTKKNVSLVERLDLDSHEGSLEKNKQAFIDKLVKSENPLTFRSDDSGSGVMLRYGEYSPNNPQLRVNSIPYLGLGEYEERRKIIYKQRQADYKEHLSKRNKVLNSTLKNIIENKSNCSVIEDKSDYLVPSASRSKAVQTDIQNIHHKLVQYELRSQNPAEKELSPQDVGLDNVRTNNRANVNFVDQKLTTRDNLKFFEMNKPKSILSTRKQESPRERLMSDLKHSYEPNFLDGFSHNQENNRLERERLRCETYQQDLLQQIEEKRRMAALREEQERREEEMENQRLQEQILKMQEEKMREERRRNYNDEQVRKCNEDFAKQKREFHTNQGFRKYTETERSTTSLRNTNVASKCSPHYSPPVSRKTPCSFSVTANSAFASPSSMYNSACDSYRRDGYLPRGGARNALDSGTRHDSLSRADSFRRQDSLNRLDSLIRQDSLLNRIESLNIRDNSNRVQRRHSATNRDIGLMKRSPKSQRSERGCCSRMDDTLPIPLLKAHSPVAKELKNSIAVSSSRHTSNAVRKLEDKWQVPAVQKNIVNHGDGSNRSILTQLGAIRLQLQQEQLRMDETLRKRGISQTKTVSDY